MSAGSVSGRYPLFRRTTRGRIAPDLTPIEILDPPAMPARSEEKWFLRLLPSAGLLIAAGFMAARGGSMMFLISGVSAAMGVFSAVAGVFSAGRRYRRELAARTRQYESYIYAKTGQISRARRQEKEILERIYIPMEDVLRQVETFSRELFDRTPSDEDFLHSRLGSADVAARRPVLYQKRERMEHSDPLQQIPEELCREFSRIRNAPAVLDLKTAGVLGIAGRAEDRHALMRMMAVDLAARHFYTDVKLVFIALPEHAAEVSLFRFLPHVRLEEGGLRGVACEEESRDEVFEYLYRELSRREQEKGSLPHLVVFLCDDCGFNCHPLSGYTGMAAQLGVTFVSMAESMQEVLPGCSSLIDLLDHKSGYLVSAGNMQESLYFSYPGLRREQAEHVSALLAPVVTEEISLEQSLTQKWSLFEMLQIRKAQDWDLAAHWSSVRTDQGMAVPVGLSVRGVVSLDLHERGHGPHGLVAGTTGSGKSEILLTYILSAAAHFPPDELRFLIIDFKGGGMAHRLNGLPHLAGVITNTEGQAVARSLRSIRAELLRRQQQLDAAGVSHIDEYLKKYRKDHGIGAMPHLVMIVDEFAELRAEHPEFMKELISAARIGRSLGVHLILATQKPSGQVNEQIWSNSRFRICMKVQDKADSNEVLHSPLAAEIREAGRAYLQVGNNEIFELFQSAYSQGPVPSAAGQEEAVRIFRVSAAGRRTLLYSDRPQAADANACTQSDALLAHIRSFCEARQIRPLPEVCPGPLPQVLPFVKTGEKGPGLRVQIGLYDDPDHQRTDPFRIDPAGRNLLVTGASKSGKSSLLRVILAGITCLYSPQEVHIYILDTEDSSFPSCPELPHVGGIVRAGESGKLNRLLCFLRQEIRRRKDAAASGQEISSFPRILLLIDHLQDLKEQYFRDDEELLRLFQEGRGAGLCVAAATPRASGLGGRFLACFEERIALYSNDSAEYNTLFEHCRIRPDQIPGRCLVQKDKEIYECQIYQAEGFPQIPGDLAGCPPAPPIPSVPQVLTRRDLARYTERAADPHGFTAGLDLVTAEAVCVDLDRQNLLTVMGEGRGGRDAWMKTVLCQLAEQRAAIFLADTIRRPFADLREQKVLQGYGVSASDAAAFACRIAGELKERYQRLLEDPSRDPAAEPLQLLVLHGMEAVQAVCGDPEALGACRDIVGRYRGLGGSIALLISGQVPLSFNVPELLRDARDRREAVYFGELREFGFFDLPLALLREADAFAGYGEAFYLKGGGCRKLKVALD